MRPTAQELRALAEAKLKMESKKTTLTEGNSKDIDRILHELRVHQIQLEMQNEELRKTQTDLEKSRQRYSDLYHLAPVGYLTLNDKWLIVEANETAAELLATDRATLIDTPITRFILPEDQDIFYHQRLALFREGKSLSWEIRFLRPDAKPFWVHCEASVHSDANDARSAHVIISDITLRKNLETSQRILDKQNQVSQRLQSLGTLTGGIAHDFNNHLAAIQANLDLAQLALQQKKEESVTAYLKEATETIAHSSTLVGQLLTYSKDGAPKKVEGDLGECIREAVQRTLTDSATVCKLDIPKDLWKISFDPQQISQVIHNLVINAHQAMPKGGSITIALRNILLARPEVKEAQPYICISVKDQGVGIPTALLSQIFDPFFTTKPKGHGLGLSTCASIVTRHGGFMEVESKPDYGTTFFINLPATN